MAFSGSIDESFDKLKEQENGFFSSQFLSPALRNVPIRVRINGVIVSLKVRQFEGWGVFAPSSYKTAKLVRIPNRTEREAYLNLFKPLRLILCRKEGDVWLGCPANKADTRFKINGLVPVHLTEEVQLFETVIARFDGAVCWFDKVDMRADPKTPYSLREYLNDLKEPENIELPCYTQEQRDAYLFAYGPALAADIEAKRDKNEDRIKDALVRAGAKYQSYIDRGDTYTIEFLVSGQRHKSVVKKDTLQVESAGICLSGGDSSFDLNSLVGVIAEGERKRRIVRVGTNYGDHNYGSEDDQEDW